LFSEEGIGFGEKEANMNDFDFGFGKIKTCDKVDWSLLLLLHLLVLLRTVNKQPAKQDQQQIEILSYIVLIFIRSA
jgi:hypothetical protein